MVDSPYLTDQVLAAYAKTALLEVAKLGELLPPRPDDWKPPSKWQKFRWRWKRRWERLLSYRLVSMEDYHNRWDY